ncbi:MAG: hypothetical protein IKK01_00720 [Clostridia bacterium]|nr:hypothetical protein [Clostridia bacterium]
MLHKKSKKTVDKKSKLYELGWSCDFESLKHWKNRAIIPNIHDRGFVSPDEKYLFVIYSICEVAMGHSKGFLALFANKDDRELLIDRDHDCYSQSPIFISESTAILYERVLHNDSGELLDSYMLFDCENRCFAFIPYRRYEQPRLDFYHTEIEKITDFEYRILPLDVSFDIRKLIYHSFDKINSFKKISLNDHNDIIPIFENTEDIK